MKNTREVIGNIFEVLFGLSDFPVLGIPLDLHVNRLVSKASIMPGAFRRLLISPPNIVNLRLKCSKKDADRFFFEMSNRWRLSKISWIWKSLAASEKPKSLCFLFWKDRTRTHFCFGSFLNFQNEKPTPVSTIVEVRCVFGGLPC